MARLLLFMLFALIFIQPAKAQDSTITIDNKIYQKYGSVWYQYDSNLNDTFRVNMNVITVKFKDSISSSQINSFLTIFGLNVIGKPVLGWYNLYVDSANDIFSKFNAIYTHSFVSNSYISVFLKFYATPSDPLFTSQWYLARISIENAWDITTGDPSVIIAVLDSGVEFRYHKDITKQTNNYTYSFTNNEYDNVYTNLEEEDWTSPLNPTTGNNIDDDDWDEDETTYIDDYKGWCFYGIGLPSNAPVSVFFTPEGADPTTCSHHGTMVAGIIGAKTNNSYLGEYLGISGIAGGWNNYGCKILPIKVGEQGPIGIDASIIPEAIMYACQLDAKIINMSYGGTEDPAIVDAIEYAHNMGKIIIAASGNNNVEYVSFPANHPNVIAVGATNMDDQRALFIEEYCSGAIGGSNYGDKLDISAPGVSILSTTMNETFSDDTYRYTEGTFFSAPQVTGVTALILSINPCLTNEQVREILCYSADKTGGYNYNWNPIDKPGHSKELGYGRLNAYHAVMLAQDMYNPSWDLYMRDRYFDMGVEPNADNVMYISKDIWIRNADDDGLTHENPIYDPVNPVYVYVRVRNKGCEDYPGGEADLYMYWAKASTGLSWPSPWTDVSGSPQMGGMIGSVEIPAIPIGGEVIVKLPWMVPDPEEYENEFVSSGMFTVFNDRHHFCLLARIVSTSDSMTITETSDNFNNVKGNNNIVQKNISILDASATGSKMAHGIVSLGNFGINNIVPYDFKITTNSEFTTRNLIEDAVVIVKLDSITWNKWVAGGMQSVGLSVLDQGVNHELKLTDTAAYLKNISYSYLESSRIAVNVSFANSNNYDSRYAIDMVQLLNSTTIIGGERFEIIAPVANGNRPDRHSEQDALTELNSTLLKLYPNPAGDWIQYEIDENTIVFSAMIMDIHGREAYKLKAGNKIDISNLSPGVYILKLITNQGVFIEKFIKE